MFGKSAATSPAGQPLLTTLRQSWVILASIIVVLLIGSWFMRWRIDYQGIKARERLMEQTLLISHAIDWRRALALSFTNADESNPIFHELSAQLKAYSQAIGQPNIYTTMLRGGVPYFGPESIPPGDPLASPVGTPYLEPPEELLEVFATAEPRVAGPFTDEYGSFVSGFAPVIDQRTGEVLMVVGLDVSAEVWSKRIARQRSVPMFFTLLLLAVLTVGNVIIVWRDDHPAASPTRHRLRYAEASLTALCGLIVTVAAMMMVADEERRMRNEVFQRMARDQAHAVRDSLMALRDRIRGLELFIHVAEEPDAEGFRRFAKPLIDASAVEILSYLPRVGQAERESFENELGERGFPEAFIYELDEAGGKQLAGERPVYYPILHTEPMEKFRTAIGFDALSHPDHQAAMDRAAQTGFPASPQPLPLVLQDLEIENIIVYSPVFGPVGHSPELEPEGFVVALIRPQPMLERIVARHILQNQCTSIDLFQLGVNQPPDLLASMPRNDGEVMVPKMDFTMTSSGSFEASFPIFIFGNAYTVVSRPTPAFHSTHPSQYITLAGGGGLLLTFVTSLLVTFMSNRRDILEKRVAKQTRLLLAERSILQQVFDSSRAGYWDWQIDEDQVRLSDGMLSMLGIGKDEAPRRMEELRSLALEEDRGRVQAAFERALEKESDQPFQIEVRCKRRDGAVSWVRCSGVVVGRDAGGKPVRMVGSHIDITESREAQAMVRGVLDASNEGVMAFRAVRGAANQILDFEFLLANKAACLITGRKERDLIGKRLLRIFPGNKTEGLFDLYCRVTEEGYFLKREFHYERDELNHWFMITALKYEDGFIVSFEDMTARHFAEDAASKRQQEYRALSDNIDDLVTRVDLQQRHLFANEAFCRFTGLKESQVIGRTLLELGLPEGLANGWSRAVDRCRTTGAIQSSKFTFSGQDGVRDYEARIIPETDLDGQLESILIIARNVTDPGWSADLG